jgi:hypothetical protein
MTSVFVVSLFIDQIRKEYTYNVRFFFKGILDFLLNINWIYSYQLSTQLPILSDILFDNQTASFFLASGSKV